MSISPDTLQAGMLGWENVIVFLLAFALIAWLMYRLVHPWRWVHSPTANRWAFIVLIFLGLIVSYVNGNHSALVRYAAILFGVILALSIVIVGLALRQTLAQTVVWGLFVAAIVSGVILNIWSPGSIIPWLIPLVLLFLSSVAYEALLAEDKNWRLFLGGWGVLLGTVLVIERLPKWWLYWGALGGLILIGLGDLVSCIKADPWFLGWPIKGIRKYIRRSGKMPG